LENFNKLNNELLNENEITKEQFKNKIDELFKLGSELSK